jgi:hypothetical protein
MILLYIDPGTGSMLISAVIALFSVIFFMIKGFLYRKFSIGGSKGIKLDTSKKYGLVFFSEGGQYWSVFNPLLEELNRRCIHATYFSSSEDDPGLSANLEYLDTHFIGTGKEAYYFLNHLSAEIVVMTTPGLDVLQIKKSKDVKHYCHVTHGAGGAALYKTYGTDYYDSVLVGGDGDRQLILELEAKRNINKKEVKIIGCTYLDVFREKMTNTKYDYTFFPQKRLTVLVSPTWGNHGLLTRYGETLLSTLNKSDLFNVIIRPHPQSFISEEKLVEKLINTFPNNDHRVWDKEFDGLKAMAHADIMISDFSGIIFDFIFLFEKPILTMHGHSEKRGRDAMDLEDEPWEIRILDKVGRTICESDLEVLPEIIISTLNQNQIISTEIAKAKNDMDKYPGESGVRGIDFIITQLAQQKNCSEAQVQLNNTNVSEDGASLSNKKIIGFRRWINNLVKILLHPNTFLQIVVALIVFNGYFFIGNIFLPMGSLNQLFLNYSFPYLAIFSFFLFCMFIGLTWWRGKGELLFRKKHEPFMGIDFILLTLPMTPIMQYIVANQEILSFSDSIIVFGFFFLLSSIFVVFLPWLLSTVVSRNLTQAISLGFVYIIFNMANLGNKIRLIDSAGLLIVISGAIFLLLFFKKKYLIIVVTIFFVTNIGVSFFMKSSIGIDAQTSSADSRPKIFEYTSDVVPERTPDIFLLIYESYSNQETMDYYGFDNNNQMQYLLEHGFTIYDGTYTIGATSLISIAYVLNQDVISEKIHRPKFRKVIASDAAGLELFNNLGYITHSVFTDDYLTRGNIPKYDFNFPDAKSAIDSYNILIKAILEGEFRFDAEFSTVNYETYVQHKRTVLSQNLVEPEFMYTHNEYPGHSQNSGVLLPNETELYIEGVTRANNEMRLDIESLNLENRDAIVIIAGDHGPYLTKNGISLSSYDFDEIEKMDIQDRYGSFLAIYWPNAESANKFDIQILQDVLPAVFSYMYNDDNLFDKTRMVRETLFPATIGGAVVKDGIIFGGKDDGKPLFENSNIRFNNKNKSE